MSCLFKSLAHFVVNNDSDGPPDEHEIRRLICDYLQTNPIVLDDLKVSDCIWEKGMALDKYVRCMRSPETWGGSLEIKAFADMFKTQITVIGPGGPSVYHPRGTTLSEITLIYNGQHYEPKTN